MRKKSWIALGLGVLYCLLVFTLYRATEPDFKFQEGYKLELSSLYPTFIGSEEYRLVLAQIEGSLSSQPNLAFKLHGPAIYVFAYGRTHEELSKASEELNAELNRAITSAMQKFDENVAVTKKVAQDVLGKKPANRSTAEHEMLKLLFYEKYENYIRAETAHPEDKVGSSFRLNKQGHWHQYNPNFIVSLILSVLLPLVAGVIPIVGLKCLKSSADHS